ncbi:MAG: thiazole synthase [Spirochaetales bacterium]|nr:thiazole synthase [Spirochaetales bacterium]
MNDTFILGEKSFSSRLILGTGKFASAGAMLEALNGANAEMITVALRRVDLNNPDDNILSVIDRTKYIILPNTSGAQNADEAIRLARLARRSGISDWIKLEVTPDPHYLLPDGNETLKAAEILVKEGFKVMPYIQADPILAKKLEEAGTVSVMPLGSPIGSNMGIKTFEFIKIIIKQSRIPVVVDAGIGRPSDAAIAMEMGADAVLINTAIADSPEPGRIARAFRLAVEAGRLAYKAGMGEVSEKANPSSVLEWVSKIQ